MNYRFRVAFIAIILCLFVLMATGWSYSNSRHRNPSQNQEKVIEKAWTKGKEPVDVKILAGGKAIKFGEKFSSDAEWMKGLSLTIKNKSDKTITFVSIALDFPEALAGGGRAMAQHQILLGKPLDLDSSTAEPFILAPGQSYDIPLAARYDSIKQLVERSPQSMDNISKITFRLDSVGYEDGTLYSGGEIYRRNPDASSSRKWIKIGEQLSTPEND